METLINSTSPFNHGNNTVQTNGLFTSTHNPYYNVTFDPKAKLKEGCIDLYKQLVWDNIYNKQSNIFTNEQHENMINMLNSNDEETLKLLIQILTAQSLL